MNIFVFVKKNKKKTQKKNTTKSHKIFSVSKATTNILRKEKNLKIKNINMSREILVFYSDTHFIKLVINFNTKICHCTNVCHLTNLKIKKNTQQ